MMECPFSEEQLTCARYFNPYLEWGMACRKCQVDNPFKAEYFHMPELAGKKVQSSASKARNKNDC